MSQSKGEKRQLSHIQEGPDVIFHLFTTKWKLKSSYVSLSSPPRLLMFHLHDSMCHSFPFVPHLRGSLLPQECSPCPWGLCKGWTMCTGHPVMGTFPGCHPQLWPVTPLNTTCTHTPPAHVGSEFGDFHAEVTPSTIKLKSPVPGTATGAKAQEVRPWSIWQGEEITELLSH